MKEKPSNRGNEDINLLQILELKYWRKKFLKSNLATEVSVTIASNGKNVIMLKVTSIIYDIKGTEENWSLYPGAFGNWQVHIRQRFHTYDCQRFQKPNLKKETEINDIMLMSRTNHSLALQYWRLPYNKQYIYTTSTSTLIPGLGW